MPYNIKPITDPGLIESRRNADKDPRTAQIHREHEKRLNGFIRDFDLDDFENRIHIVRSSLTVVQIGMNELLENHDIQCKMGESYYFTIMGIQAQIDELETMVMGFDEYVSQRRAKEMGLDDWLPENLAEVTFPTN